jgi:hypothetical protein
VNHYALSFAVFAAILYAAHQLADHVFGQTDNQSSRKADAGRDGWRALVGHVVAYHVVMAVMVTVSVFALRLDPSMWGLAAGFAFSVLTHGFLDRRWPVRWVLEHTGSRPFSRMTSPICGMYLADQALHYGCLWVAALLMACV